MKMLLAAGIDGHHARPPQRGFLAVVSFFSHKNAEDHPMRAGLPGPLRPSLFVVSAVFLLGLLSGTLWAQPARIPTTYQYMHEIAPRLQWNENDGYCGETSFISAGLRFGQYCSQFTARSLASPGINQSNPASQMLLGVNDVSAARQMKLQASAFANTNQQNTKDFLMWIKNRTLAGRVVIIGVFNNGILLGEWTGRDDGDPDYDHIVPVLGFGSNSSLSGFASEYIATDVITVSDNGLYGPFGSPPAYQFLYSFRLSIFPGTRVQANNPEGPVYLLKNTPKNYGIAIEGVLDPGAETIPVALTSNINYEPPIARRSNTPPAPIPITLTATVSIPNQNVAYNLYRYDTFEKVPVSGFNAAAGHAVQIWRIAPNSGAKVVFSINTTSDKTVIFRAVHATAPPPPPANPVLSVTPASASVGAASGRTNLSVSNTGSGAMSYSASVSAGSNWLQITSGASGGNSGIIKLIYAANSGLPRTGQVTATANGANGSPTIITLTQATTAGTPAPTPTPPIAGPVLTVTPMSASVPSTSGRASLSVSNAGRGTMSYAASISAGSNWLSITNGSSGGNSGVIRVFCMENTGVPRTGQVTITATGASRSPTNVTITQAAKSPR